MSELRLKKPPLWKREKNSGEQISQMSGYIPLRQQIRSFEEAGKKLIEHRCLAYPAKIGVEEVDTSIFGKRYYDRIDIAELEKKNKEKIAELQNYARQEHIKSKSTTTSSENQERTEEIQKSAPTEPKKTETPS